MRDFMLIENHYSGKIQIVSHNHLFVGVFLLHGSVSLWEYLCDAFLSGSVFTVAAWHYHATCKYTSISIFIIIIIRNSSSSRILFLKDVNIIFRNKKLSCCYDSQSHGVWRTVELYGPFSGTAQVNVSIYLSTVSNWSVHLWLKDNLHSKVLENWKGSAFPFQFSDIFECRIIV